jgi:DNA modification methylase
MGRHSIYKKGAMTAAQRQARRREKLRREAFAAKCATTQERRRQSRLAKPVPGGMELRVGDARIVLADVPDNSVPLILTDPPYGDEAEPLYRWLADFAARVLIPGGSLICYTGQSRLNRDIRIFNEKLRYWWQCTMEHHQSQRIPGKFVIATFKPILWYVKEFRRGRSLVVDTLVSPARDKDLHAWSQGDGGVSPLIEHLTEPGELMVDPFAGTAKWGDIAVAMGRRWLGADIELGGSTMVAAE